MSELPALLPDIHAHGWTHHQLFCEHIVAPRPLAVELPQCVGNSQSMFLLTQLVLVLQHEATQCAELAFVANTRLW